MNSENNITTHPYLSVILPVYNAEKWVDKAISSVVNQSYKNFELIVVFDCCGDDSETIVKKFQKKDGRLILKSLDRNVGVAQATNVGLKLARAPYVVFMDHDDAYLPYAFENMVKNHDPQDDLSVFGAVERKNTSDILHSAKLIKAKCSDYVNYMLSSGKDLLFSTNWGKIYKKDIIDKMDIPFNPDINFGQDMAFNFRYLTFSNRVSVYPDAVYIWNRRMDNLTLSERRLKTIDSYHQKRKCLDYYLSFVPDDAKKIVIDCYVLSQYVTLRELSLLRYKQLKEHVIFFSKNDYYLASKTCRRKINLLTRLLINARLYSLLTLVLVVKKKMEVWRHE